MIKCEVCCFFFFKLTHVFSSGFQDVKNQKYVYLVLVWHIRKYIVLPTFPESNFYLLPVSLPFHSRISLLVQLVFTLGRIGQVGCQCWSIVFPAKERQWLFLELKLISTLYLVCATPIYFECWFFKENQFRPLYKQLLQETQEFPAPVS